METKEWFVQQVKLYESGMYRLAMSILYHEEDARDAAQEAVCIAYQKIGMLRDKERFRPWIMRILVNECYRILREKKRVVVTEEWDEKMTGTWEMPDQQLLQAVGRLNEDMRAVVVLFYYEGFSIKEIAGILKLSESNVKTRMFRARKQLKEILMEDEE